MEIKRSQKHITIGVMDGEDIFGWIRVVCVVMKGHHVEMCMRDCSTRFVSYTTLH